MNTMGAVMYNPMPIYMLLGVFLFGGLMVAIVMQVMWMRRKKNRRGFPIEPPDRER